MIPPEYVRNFDALTHAFGEEAVFLLACREKDTGKTAYVLCAVQPRGQEYEYVPLARLFDADPHTQLEPLPPAPAPAQEVEPDIQTPPDDYTAILIAEEVMPATDARRLAAWQHLVDTGLAWRLQGWFGRTAAALIEDGLLRDPRRHRPA
jgi:hypothetical protein